MSAHVLLNLLNELGKRDKMRGNEFNKVNNSRARILDSTIIWHLDYFVLSYLVYKKL